MITWEELKAVIEQLPPEQRHEPVKLFDYGEAKFYEPDLCLEGEPPVHLTIDRSSDSPLSLKFQAGDYCPECGDTLQLHRTGNDLGLICSGCGETYDLSEPDGKPMEEDT